jgi:hypothetical protein
VILQRTRVVATAGVELDPDEGVAPQVNAFFLSHAPLTRGASVRIGLDWPIAQLKSVHDAPPSADRATLERALLENADRYFIGGAGERHIAVRAGTDRTVLVAFERACVDEIVNAAFEAGASEVVLCAAPMILPLAGRAIGAEFGVAHGAASAALRDLACVRMAARRRMRLTWASAAALGTVAAGLLATAPLIQAHLRAAGAERELKSIQGESNAALGVRDRRDELRRRIDHVALPSTTSMTELLSEVTNALPPGASLLALSVDSARGSAVILAVNAVAALPALDSVQLMANVRLSGPVTRERLADRDLDRATILFTLRASR